MLEKGLINAVEESQRIFNINNLYRFYMDKDDIADNLVKKWSKAPGDALEVSINLVQLATDVYQQAIVEDSDDENDDGEEENNIDVENALKSTEYKKYLNAVAELAKVNINKLGVHAKLAFFLNVYQAMYVHHFLRRVNEEGVNQEEDQSGGILSQLNQIK